MNKDIAKIKVTKNSAITTLFSIVKMFILALVAFVVLFSFVFRLATVDGSSMKNTLYNGDKIVVSELYSKPESGDIIVANSTDSLGKIIVKRVIATEGQTLKIDYDNNQVIVDGIIYDEPYISSITNEPTDYWTIPTVIPEGYVFVMGDNRAFSLDSRDNRLQLVSVNDIVGKAEFIIFPLNRIQFLN